MSLKLSSLACVLAVGSEVRYRWMGFSDKTRDVQKIWPKGPKAVKTSFKILLTIIRAEPNQIQPWRWIASLGYLGIAFTAIINLISETTTMRYRWLVYAEFVTTRGFAHSLRTLVVCSVVLMREEDQTCFQKLGIHVTWAFMHRCLFSLNDVKKQKRQETCSEVGGHLCQFRKKYLKGLQCWALTS